MLLALLIAAAPAFDVSIYPFSPQLNTTWTTQFGGAATLGLRPATGFSLVATGYFSYPVVSTGSSFSEELISKARAVPAGSLALLDAYAGLGTELTPVEGDLGGLPFQVVVSGGLGAASTRVQLKPRNEAGPATYGDTGWKPAWAVGLGARLQLYDWLSLRFEVRDFIVSSMVSNVNGCSRADLGAIDASSRLRGDTGSPQVSAGCRSATFDGVETFGRTDGAFDRKRADDVPIAYSLIRLNRAEWLHDIQLLIGVTVTF